MNGHCKQQMLHGMLVTSISPKWKTTLQPLSKLNWTMTVYRTTAEIQTDPLPASLHVLHNANDFAGAM